MPTRAQRPPVPRFRLELQLAIWIPLVLALLWVYGAAWASMLWQSWAVPDQAHRPFVPLFSLALLWFRRDLMEGYAPQGSWWGLPWLLAAGVLQGAAAWYVDFTLHVLSMLPCLAGVVLFVWGWPALRWAWPSIGFLILMFPMPEEVSSLLSVSLQRVATIISTYVLQTVGIPAYCEGNVIVLREAQVGVLEACSGIRLLGVSFAACVGAGLLVTPLVWKRVLLVLSAIPIALAANVARITALAMLHEFIPGFSPEGPLHDFVGWCTMPLAMVLLFVELALLSWFSRRGERSRGLLR